MSGTEEERIAWWSDKAQEIIDQIKIYEDEHPQGALCLHPLLMVLDQCSAVDTSPLGHVYPNAGACGREGCNVLHDDAANPIHPEDLTKDFHERTGRCFGGNPQAEIHPQCARTEQRHKEGDHGDCLPVEDGFTAEDVRRAERYLSSHGFDGADVTVHEWLLAQRFTQAQDYIDRNLHTAAMLIPPNVGRQVTVARCGVRIDLGLGDVQQCERPEDFRHEQHRVEDYNGSPLIWMEDHPRSRSLGEVTAIEVPGIRVEYGPNRVRSDWDTLTGDQKMQARLDGTEYREPTLEERVAALEARLATLEARPSPYDVIG